MRVVTLCSGYDSQLMAIRNIGVPYKCVGWSEIDKYAIMTHNAIVYTIVNFSTTIEQDLERIYTLRDMGYWPYVMIYDKEHCARIYRRMARWVNNRFIFASCKRFEDYKG